MARLLTRLRSGLWTTQVDHHTCGRLDVGQVSREKSTTPANEGGGRRAPSGSGGEEPEERGHAFQRAHTKEWTPPPENATPIEPEFNG